uniref:Uncharacterized protein n=1 Tax=Panagrolaimus sp. PS1159 TaxID=55785 RepID=A0AC35FK97_9BILA
MDYHYQLPSYLTYDNAFHSQNYSKFSSSNIRNNDTRARFGLPTTWHIDLCALNKAQGAWQRDLRGHTSCVNAVEFNKSEDLFATGGDDLRVILWRVSNALTDEKPKPFTIMKTKHDSNIFALAFTHDSKKVMSAGNDDRFIVHDIETGAAIHSYRGSTYYCLSVHGDNDNIVAAATDNSRVYLYDTRAPPGEPVQCLREIGENFCVNFNQKIPYLMAVCNKSKGLSVIDIRAGNDDFCIRAGPATKEAIYASWNEAGDALFCIRSGKLPVYLDTKKQVPLICKDDGYRNSITIKSCDFVGNEYAITGSDKWDIYCWKIPKDYDDKIEEGKLYATHSDTEQAYTTFKGHRSIVNHTRYSKTDDIILSCGVEKVVKLWSGAKLSTSYREHARRPLFIEDDNDMDDEEENGIGDDADENEDLNTLRLFDQYMRTEGNNQPYTIDGENRRRASSSSSSAAEVPPPVFRNEVPERNRFRSGAGFIREILQQLVHSPHLDLQGLGDSDESESDENDDANNNELSSLDGFYGEMEDDNDETQFRYAMETSPEESSTNESSSNSSSSTETSSDSSILSLVATPHESDASQGREEAEENVEAEEEHETGEILSPKG